MLDLIILGSGPAGISAAIYASRYAMKFVIIGKDYGLAGVAGEIENYPGIYPTRGFELMQKFEEHAKKLGIEIVREEIIELKKEQDGFIVKTANNEYKAKCVIYALGGKKRKLGIENEEKYVGKGISYCATCDAALYKKKIVGVIGGSNSAVGAALLLSNFASKVYLIYRKEKIRAFPKLVEKLQTRENIEVITKAIVKKLLGNEVLSGIVLDHDGQEKEIKLDGLFLELGHEPNSDLAKSLGIEVDNTNRIVVKEDMSTNIAGLFAAGDVTNGSNKFDQIVTAVAEGAIAAYSTYKFISE